MYNVIDFLKESADKYKDKIAVVEEDKKITYYELNSLSKKVGSFLCKEGLFNSPIIVYMDKGIDALISFFGIIYSGCYYTLVNPELPENRILNIKDVLESKYIITDNNNIDKAKEFFNDLTILNIDDLKKEKIDELVLKNNYNKHIDTDPLYINFTSGSTGIPKGVVISHRSVIDFINVFTNKFKFSSNDIFANQAPFDFDVSVKDIYSSIKMGTTLVIVPKRYFSSPSLLLDYICFNNVTILIWAVSALCLITTFHGLDYKVPTTVKKVLFSGEVMPLKHLNIWLKHLPDATFVNIYGPTEITCNCTYHIIDRNREYDKIPIGKSFPNERVLLLDENNKEINMPNITGEICVSGTCLGLGYYNNFQQTNNHFVQNPNNGCFLDLIYRTGDLAFYDDNNELVFIGRKDFQVKYLGHRIELEEIEKDIEKCSSVIRSCVIFDEEKSKLYGFYIGDISKKDLHIELSKLLPVYMIPTYLIKMDNFPLTKNGKIDRKKLMEGEKKTC